jgi:putative tryptophan/tyrosine transport system substrate-binding protein
MRRRECIALLGGVAGWPIIARTQQSGNLPHIGFLGANTAFSQGEWTTAFAQRLAGLGWVPGHTIVIDYRWAEGRFERSSEIIAEFVRLKVDVIVTHGTENVIAARQATSIIPIVFPVAGDPVGNGLVASLARPGGNVTGLSFLGPDLAGKRLELAREVVPRLRRLAVLRDVENPINVLEMREVHAAANALDLDVTTLDIRRPEEIAPAIKGLKDRSEALYVPLDPLFTSNHISIVSLALGERLPTICGVRLYVQTGGLVSYGPKLSDMFRRAAETLLARADEVIE